MATIDITRRPLVIGGTHEDDRELPQPLIEELFDRVAQTRNLRPGSEWVSTIFAETLAPEAFDDEEAVAASEETVLRSDEVTREALSFASRPVVIEVTDEQAEQFLRFKKRSASAR